MIRRFLYRGVLWVALGWSVGLAIGSWARSEHTQAFVYTGLSTALVNILWMERRIAIRQRKEVQ